MEGDGGSVWLDQVPPIAVVIVPTVVAARRNAQVFMSSFSGIAA